MNTDYVAFEGVDGSGKTSYIEALSSHLEKKSINFKVVREPGGSKPVSYTHLTLPTTEYV